MEVNTREGQGCAAEPPRPFEWNYCGICGKPLTCLHDGERERPYCDVCNRHYYHNPVPACCIFVRDSEGCLLFGRRAVEPCYGEWALPGGFMEINETGEQCALREMQEETGLVASHARLLGVSSTLSRDKGAVLVLGYVIGKWRGTLTPYSDVSDLRFYSRDTRPPVPFNAHRELLALYDSLNP